MLGDSRPNLPPVRFVCSLLSASLTMLTSSNASPSPTSSMKKETKVTILLATRNGAAFLPKQLESFVNQTYDNWELIVSDDGSTDGTLKILHDFAERVSQRVIIRQGPMLGFWQNFVALVRSGEGYGPLFAYSDQDDVWFPQKLQNAVSWFNGLPSDKPALYFTRTELITEGEELIGLSKLFCRKPTFRNALVQNMGGGNTMVFNSIARDVLLLTSPGAQLVAHDWWTYQVVSGVGGEVYYDPRPSLRYRQHGKNIFGANLGMRSRLTRLRGLARGLLADWNSANLKVLTNSALPLTPENRMVAILFSKACSSSFPLRLYYLLRSGVYRQNATETLGLYLGAFFGRI